jgi:Glucose-repressible protein Grg1
MDTVKNAANYVSDKVQSTTASASKEANKEVAKDSNASIGNR